MHDMAVPHLTLPLLYPTQARDPSWGIRDVAALGGFGAPNPSPADPKISLALALALALLALALALSIPS